jgi:hypothetical protein
MKSFLIILFYFCFNFVFSQDSIIEYYNEVAGKPEYGNKNSNGFRKWTQDVNIFFDFENSDSIKIYSKEILKDLNDLINPINLEIVNNKNEANILLYFGDFIDYKIKYNIKNDGSFLGYASTRGVNNVILNSYIFINKKLSGTELKSVLREEITQSLGFCNDSWKYPKSIFYQGKNLNTQFSEIDKKIIQLHYNN